jgi:steroid delta-isomerase-like uncharacterized protein
LSTDETEINKAAVKRFAEAANTHDPELISRAVDEVFDANWRAGWQMPIEANGLQGVKNVFATLHAAFPDLHISLEDLIADGDKVVTRERITGTHRGNYMGVPATGKQVAYNEIVIARFADGRIVESWGVVDVLSLMRQLGAIPAGPGQPESGARREATSEPQPSGMA